MRRPGGTERERLWHCAAPLALVAVVAFAYSGAMSAAFQFDDWNVIVLDPRVASLSAWWAAFPGIRPLLRLSWALQNAAGAGPRGFHAVNVAIHAAAALAVYALLRRLASSAAGEAAGGAPARWTDRRSSPAPSRVALGGALLFALHPAQTEAVTYVSGRSSSLSALLCLASALSWMAGRERGSGWLLHAASPLLFVLALGVKETAVVLPLALALLWVTVGPPREPILRAGVRAPVRDFLAASRVHWIVLAAAAGALVASPAYRYLLAVSLQTRGIVPNFRTQALGVVWLIGQLVRFDRLDVDPKLPVVTRWSPDAVLAAVAVCGLIVFGFALLRARGGFALLRARASLGFGILWFFLWLAPTNSLVARLDVANDRQLYLAMVGPAWLAARSIAALERRLRRTLARPGAARIAGAACVAALCLTFLIVTRQRNAVYRDEIVFWQDAVGKSPGNGRAHANLGYAYALSCRDGEAEAAFLEALRIDPSDVKAAVNLRLLREGALRPPPGSPKRRHVTIPCESGG